MIDFWNQPWFGWALAIVIGLPLLLIALTELGGWLTRRGNPAAKPVLFLRNFVLPVGAFLALVALGTDIKADVTWVRITATVFGFLVILLLLSSVNVVIFGSPQPGSWRDRLPSIFIDLGRLALIVIGLAVLFQWVWDADVGGLIAALGVTSIVIGLALQNAVGSIISGLLLLFEQPFRIGDWLLTSEGKGRVVQVNWRAVHIETPEGTLVMPTAALADGSFTNLSRPTSAHMATVEVTFGAADAPHDVSAMLVTLAADLPMADSLRHPAVRVLGPGTYAVEIPLHSPADEDDARSLFYAWLWYAASRHGLHWAGGAPAEPLTAEGMAPVLTAVARTLRLPVSELESHIGDLRIDHYAAGELVQRAGEVPEGMRIVTEGAVSLAVDVPGGGRVPIDTLDRGTILGQTALTRETVPAAAIALTPVSTVYLPRDLVDTLISARPALGTLIGRSIDNRKRQVTDALAAGSVVRLPPRTQL